MMGTQVIQWEHLPQTAMKTAKKTVAPLSKRCSYLGTWVTVKPMSYIQYCNSHLSHSGKIALMMGWILKGFFGGYSFRSEGRSCFFFFFSNCEIVWIWKRDFAPFMWISLSWAWISSPSGAIKNFLLCIIKTNTHLHMDRFVFKAGRYSCCCCKQFLIFPALVLMPHLFSWKHVYFVCIVLNKHFLGCPLWTSAL